MSGLAEIDKGTSRFSKSEKDKCISFSLFSDKLWQKKVNFLGFNWENTKLVA